MRIAKRAGWFYVPWCKTKARTRTWIELKFIEKGYHNSMPSLQCHGPRFYDSDYNEAQVVVKAFMAGHSGTTVGSD
jgi:hypothetical protein